jgi:ABC-type uncharacterized transport system permease subunit
MLTDYALGIENLFFSIVVYSRMHPKNRVTGLLLLLGFFAHALSAMAGGTFHGFALYVSPSTRQELWNLVVLSTGATLGFLASGIHAAEVHREDGKWIVAGVTIAVLGLGIQVSGFRAHQFLSQNDIFHTIQIAAMYLFFRGSSHLEDRTQR